MGPTKSSTGDSSHLAYDTVYYIFTTKLEYVSTQLSVLEISHKLLLLLYVDKYTLCDPQ
jgi:hypothetical protein